MSTGGSERSFTPRVASHLRPQRSQAYCSAPRISSGLSSSRSAAATSVPPGGAAPSGGTSSFRSWKKSSVCDVRPHEPHVT